MTQVRESGQGRDTSASVGVGRGLTVPSLAAGWRLSPSGMALVSRACLGQLLCVKFESRCALRSPRLRHVLPKGAAGATLAGRVIARCSPCLLQLSTPSLLSHVRAILQFALGTGSLGPGAAAGGPHRSNPGDVPEAFVLAAAAVNWMCFG